MIIEYSVFWLAQPERFWAVQGSSQASGAEALRSTVTHPQSWSFLARVLPQLFKHFLRFLLLLRRLQRLLQLVDACCALSTQSGATHPAVCAETCLVQRAPSGVANSVPAKKLLSTCPRERRLVA